MENVVIVKSKEEMPDSFFLIGYGKVSDEFMLMKNLSCVRHKPTYLLSGQRAFFEKENTYFHVKFQLLGAQCT